MDGGYLRSEFEQFDIRSGLQFRHHSCFSRYSVFPVLIEGTYIKQLSEMVADIPNIEYGPQHLRVVNLPYPNRQSLEVARFPGFVQTPPSLGVAPRCWPLQPVSCRGGGSFRKCWCCFLWYPFPPLSSVAFPNVLNILYSWDFRLDIEWEYQVVCCRLVLNVSNDMRLLGNRNRNWSRGDAAARPLNTQGWREVAGEDESGVVFP